MHVISSYAHCVPTCFCVHSWYAIVFIDCYRFFLLWRDTPFFLKGAAGKHLVLGAHEAHGVILDFGLQSKACMGLDVDDTLFYLSIYVYPNMWDI